MLPLHRLAILLTLTTTAACDFGDYGPADGGAQVEPPDLSVPDLSNHDMSAAVSHDWATPHLALQDFS